MAKIAANERRAPGAVALSSELAVGAHLASLGAPAAEPSPPGRAPPRTRTLEA